MNSDPAQGSQDINVIAAELEARRRKPEKPYNLQELLDQDSYFSFADAQVSAIEQIDATIFGVGANNEVVDFDNPHPLKPGVTRLPSRRLPRIRFEYQDIQVHEIPRLFFSDSTPTSTSSPLSTNSSSVTKQNNNNSTGGEMVNQVDWLKLIPKSSHGSLGKEKDQPQASYFGHKVISSIQEEKSSTTSHQRTDEEPPAKSDQEVKKEEVDEEEEKEDHHHLQSEEQADSSWGEGEHRHSQRRHHRHHRRHHRHHRHEREEEEEEDSEEDEEEERHRRKQEKREREEMTKQMLLSELRKFKFSKYGVRKVNDQDTLPTLRYELEQRRQNHRKAQTVGDLRRKLKDGGRAVSVLHKLLFPGLELDTFDQKWEKKIRKKRMTQALEEIYEQSELRRRRLGGSGQPNPWLQIAGTFGRTALNVHLKATNPEWSLFEGEGEDSSDSDDEEEDEEEEKSDDEQKRQAKEKERRRRRRQEQKEKEKLKSLTQSSPSTNHEEESKAENVHIQEKEKTENSNHNSQNVPSATPSFPSLSNIRAPPRLKPMTP